MKLDKLIRTRNALEKLARHGWRVPSYHQIDEYGVYFVRRLRNGRMVSLLLDYNGKLSVSAN